MVGSPPPPHERPEPTDAGPNLLVTETVAAWLDQQADQDGPADGHDAIPDRLSAKRILLQTIIESGGEVV